MSESIACGPADTNCSLENRGISNSNAAIAGIVLGSVLGFLVLCCLCVCFRRERRISREGEENARRDTIVKLKESISAYRSSTAVKEMSNVERAMLKREITDGLVIKTVERSTSANGENSKKSFLESLSNSGRAYSSFASALSKSKRSVEFCTPTDDGVEQAMASKENLPPGSERRISNAMARSLSAVMSRKSDVNNPSKCFLCLTEYEMGDEVCFSPNSKCRHGFHRECIVDWLLKRQACPCCRQNYLSKDDGNTGAAADKDLDEEAKKEEEEDLETGV